MWFALPRAKTNEALAVKTESASYEPSKGEVSQPIPSALEPAISHRREPRAQGREAVSERWYMQQA
jgi:hypothetical protein